MKNKNSCNTKYPIMLIHGAGFRDDSKIFSYWGRIPDALTREGAKIYFSNQDAWGTIEKNAATIKESIDEVLKETKSKKINLIAHSKGGLESRYLISKLNMHKKIASLTTISTPHHGCKTLDTFYKWPKPIYKLVAFFVNLYFGLLGDKRPDFYTGSRQLSHIFCTRFNIKCPDMPGVYYQSYTSKMSSALSDLLLFFTYLIIKFIEGDNDGLVGVDSAKWGEFKGVLSCKKRRGISHADVIDFRGSDFSNFHVQDVYINMVRELKQKGF